MFTKLVYRGLPPSVIFTISALAQYYAVRVFV